MLLSSDFNPEDALSMLRDDYKDIISKGMFYSHFMALRLNEAKVSKYWLIMLCVKATEYI